MVAKLPTEFVLFKIFCKGKPKPWREGGLGRGCQERLVRMSMEEKRGNQLRYLNESLMQEFLNSSKGKQSFESTHRIWQYNSHGNDNEEHRGFYATDCMYVLPASSFSQNQCHESIAGQKYTKTKTTSGPKQISSSCSNVHHRFHPLNMEWFHTWSHTFPSNQNPQNPPSYLWLAPPLVAAACYGFGNL